MPFTLAHPAAVLPLRRYCPRYLSMPALLAGSVIPDTGYFFGPLRLEDLSHRFVGSFIYCLPAGVLALAACYGARRVFLRSVPERRQPAILQADWPPLGSPAVVVMSLLIGIWSHLLLDSFTHKSGWLVQHSEFLQLSLGLVAGRTVRVCTTLWYACSFAGIALVYVAFRRWRRSVEAGAGPAARKSDWFGAVLVASAVLPIELVHHLLHGRLGLLLVAGMTAALAVVVARVTGGRRVTSDK